MVSRFDMAGSSEAFPRNVAVVKVFIVSHAMHCAKGGFPHVRHNEIRDTFEKLLDEICFDVEIEPTLQPRQGETFSKKSTSYEDDARLDIKANGLWESHFNKTYNDVKIFNPFAKTSPKYTKYIDDAYNFHENAKNESRITEVENASFNPLVFACTGGAGPSVSNESNSFKDQREKATHMRK